MEQKKQKQKKYHSITGKKHPKDFQSNFKQIWKLLSKLRFGQSRSSVSCQLTLSCTMSKNCQTSVKFVWSFLNIMHEQVNSTIVGVCTSCPANIYLPFKVNNRNTRTWSLTSLTSFWYFYCRLLTYFTPFSSVSIVEFEQVNINWVLSVHIN